MNNPLRVSPSKGNQGTTRGKQKKIDLGGNQTHVLRTRSTVALDVSPSKGNQRTTRGKEKIFFLWLVWFPDSLY